MSTTLLIRYGAIPEVARFPVTQPDGLPRGGRVVVRTHRGTEIGTVLEQLGHRALAERPKAPPDEQPLESQVLRPATDTDLEDYDRLRAQCESEFAQWQTRITDWHLKLELIDVEWLVDREKLILYVLNTRGPDCTKLAIYAAAAGFDNVLVQPVGAEGLVQIETSGESCGSGNCTCKT